mmetsp:Transcript_12102/g.29652  ORF Transcript_12102/g.29652 Transcript_12102/m.29652 type:complete len:295 (-) Transcript_12102:162-1046(-)
MVSSDVHVAILFDPDDHEPTKKVINDVGRFVSTLLPHTAECTKTNKPADQLPNITLILSEEMRDLMEASKLLPQIRRANFEFLEVIFVDERTGEAADIDNMSIDELSDIVYDDLLDGAAAGADAKPGTGQHDIALPMGIDFMYRAALCLAATHIAIRGLHAVVPQSWITLVYRALLAGRGTKTMGEFGDYMAVVMRRGGFFLFEAAMHAKYVSPYDAGGPARALLVPPSCRPRSAYLQWLLMAYPVERQYEMQSGQGKGADDDEDGGVQNCDVVLQLPNDSPLDMREKLLQLKK